MPNRAPSLSRAQLLDVPQARPELQQSAGRAGAALSQRSGVREIGTDVQVRQHAVGEGSDFGSKQLAGFQTEVDHVEHVLVIGNMSEQPPGRPEPEMLTAEVIAHHAVDIGVGEFGTASQRHGAERNAGVHPQP